MSRTIKFTVSVPSRMFKALETLRAKTGMSRSQLVREALRRLEAVPDGLAAGEISTLTGVREEPTRYGNPAEPLYEITDKAERRKRALAVVGRFRSDVTDLSTEHDKYLDEAYTGGDPEADKGPGRKP